MNRTYENILQDLSSKYSKYIVDPSYVYKSYKSEWIIIMKLLSDLDINSNDIIDPFNCIYKSDKLEIVMIINKLNTDITCDKIIINDIEYNIGDIIHTQLNEKIDFYNNIMNSYLSDINLGNYNYSLDINPYKLHGLFYDYYPNGELHHEYNYVNGKLTNGYVYNYDNKHTHVYSFKRFVL